MRSGDGDGSKRRGDSGDSKYCARADGGARRHGDGAAHGGR